MKPKGCRGCVLSGTKGVPLFKGALHLESYYGFWPTSITVVFLSHENTEMQAWALSLRSAKLYPS